MLVEVPPFQVGAGRGGAEPAVLDLKHLRRFTLGQPAFEREILGLFSATLTQTLAALQSAESAAQWHMAAHTLKGSALGIGAGQLAALGREAEQMAFPAPADRGPLMARIHAAACELLQEARHHELL